MGEFMNEYDVMKVVPTKVRSVLDIIKNILQDKHGKIELLFDFELIDDNELCVLKINIGNIYEVVPIGILSKYDYLFFKQLLISLLDNFIENLTSAYCNGLTCYFIILPKDNTNVIVNVQINSTHNLCDLIIYYNERLEIFKSTQNNMNSGVFK